MTGATHPPRSWTSRDGPSSAIRLSHWSRAGSYTPTSGERSSHTLDARHRILSCALEFRITSGSQYEGTSLPSHQLDKNSPRQKLQATTFGPDPLDCLPPAPALFPGTVAARLRWRACCSDAGRMGGRFGADMGAGVGGAVSERGSVAMCGTSLSG